MRCLKAVKRNLLRAHYFLDKRVVLLTREGDVQVVPLAVLVARGAEDLLHVQAIAVDRGSDRVVEVQRIPAQSPDRLGQRIGGQRARGQNHETLRERRDLLPNHLDFRPLLHLFADALREQHPVHGQRLAGRYAIAIRRPHHERPQTPHLFVEQPDRIVDLVGAQAVGAHQLGHGFAGVRGGEAYGLHLVQTHRSAPASELPGRLAPRQAAPDHRDGFLHGGNIGDVG